MTRLGTDVDAGTRLRLRDRHELDHLADALALARHLAAAGERLADLAAARADVRGLPAAADGGAAAARARSRALEGGLARGFAHAVEVAGDLTGARIVARRLAAADGFADGFGRRRLRALARRLDRAANQALDLGRDHARRSDLVMLRRVERALARARADSIELVDLAERTASGLPGLTPPGDLTAGEPLPGGPGGSPRHPAGAEPCADELAALMAALDTARNDFAEADLAGHDLSMVDLRGVRWSPRTRWPAAWVDRVRRDSVEVDLDVLEIRASPDTGLRQLGARSRGCG